MEKHPPVEVGRVSQLSATDDECGIARQSPFGADLAPVAASPAHVPCRFGSRRRTVHARKSSAALPAITVAPFLKIPDKLKKVLPMSGREIFQVEQIDVIGRRVML